MLGKSRVGQAIITIAESDIGRRNLAEGINNIQGVQIARMQDGVTPRKEIEHARP
jgi:hypothetical protein